MIKTEAKKNILLAVTGSIAAYKSAELARLFISKGFNVRCAMTSSAEKFISALTLETITGSPVMTDLWQSNKSSYEIEHIELADWADVVSVAPASADIIAKMTYGFADSALSAVLLATRAPVLIAPAMNVNMYEHPKTRENIEELKKRGVVFIEPESGDLACGWIGKGRLANAGEVFHRVMKALCLQDLEQKRVVVSTGPTREAIDPVRFVSNRSSGKMGIALATDAYYRGAEVTLVHGPLSLDVLSTIPSEVRKISVTSAEEMKNAMLDLSYNDKLSQPHIVIMAAAVSDYRPAQPAAEKIKKSGDREIIELTMNDDILSLLGQKKSGAEPYLVGFAVETGDVEELLKEVDKKLKIKNVDLMVGNLAEDAFGLDSNRVWLVDRYGRRDEIPGTSKSRVASKVLDAVLRG